MNRTRSNKRRKQVKKKASFFKEIGVFVAVSFFLIVLNLMTSPHVFWAIWPVGFWGLALVMRAIIMVTNSSVDKWEKKEIQAAQVEDDEEFEDFDLESQPEFNYEAQKSYKNDDLV